MYKSHNKLFYWFLPIVYTRAEFVYKLSYRDVVCLCSSFAIFRVDRDRDSRACWIFSLSMAALASVCVQRKQHSLQTSYKYLLAQHHASTFRLLRPRPKLPASVRWPVASDAGDARITNRIPMQTTSKLFKNTIFPRIFRLNYPKVLRRSRIFIIFLNDVVLPFYTPRYNTKHKFLYYKYGKYIKISNNHFSYMHVCWHLRNVGCITHEFRYVNFFNNRIIGI